MKDNEEKTMSKTKIICSVHWIPKTGFKELIDQNKDLYLPICGGSLLKDSEDQWVKDNVLMDNCKKDNISVLNPILNELTTIYLVWKNLSLVGDAANIGFCHYRRLITREALSCIDTCDGIVAKPIMLGVVGRPCPLQTQYGLCHYEEDFDMLKQTVDEAGLLDQEIWNEWASNMFLFAPCNCFVFKREVFNMFCKDLFKIALQLPGKIDVSGRDDYQKRASGFLSERFTSYWCWMM